MGECTRGREGRAGEELDHRSKRGREQRENAPAVGEIARARCIIDRRGAGAASCRRETAARQRPLSSALRVSVSSTFLLLPSALLRPSAPPVCRFSPRTSVLSAFLLLRNCVTSAVQPRCRFAITPFRVYFSSLVAAKGFVLLNIRARWLAPLVVIVRGAQLFLAFLSLVSGSLRPFLLTSAVFSRSDAEFSCRCAGFSVGRGCASLALMLAFVTSCGALGASRSAFAVGRPAARAAFIASPPFITRWWKKRADFPLIHNLFSTVFSTVWRKCPPSRVFLPAFPFFHRRAHRSPPAEGRKSPLHARVYII